MDAPDNLRGGYGDDFVANFDGNPLDELYTGLVINDDNLNIGRNAISYTKGNWFFSLIEDSPSLPEGLHFYQKEKFTTFRQGRYP